MHCRFCVNDVFHTSHSFQIYINIDSDGSKKEQQWIWISNTRFSLQQKTKTYPPGVVHTFSFFMLCVLIIMFTIVIRDKHNKHNKHSNYTQWQDGCEIDVVILQPHVYECTFVFSWQHSRVIRWMQWRYSHYLMEHSQQHGIHNATLSVIYYFYFYKIPVFYFFRSKISH